MRYIYKNAHADEIIKTETNVLWPGGEAMAACAVQQPRERVPEEEGGSRAFCGGSTGACVRPFWGT